ncbi:MAG: putative photosynthetic complex assembly protein PuhE [Pseudomonadota bacterium]
MNSPWIAALAALFLWWISTGAILLLVRRADNVGGDSRTWTVLLSLPLLVIGAAGFVDTLDNGSTVGIYIAFLSALAIWGWIEMTFLAGLITGPNVRPCPEGIPEWERFIRAWGTVAYHEMLLVAVLIILAMLAHGAANPFGLWVFALLFAARVSAKLNLYLGVPYINTEFLTRPLAHLPTHFRRARLNPLFPVSVTLLTFATSCWLERLIAVPSSGEKVGYALLTALTALALLEHWFMVVPLPDAKLWRWMLPAPVTDETNT